MKVQINVEQVCNEKLFKGKIVFCYWKWIINNKLECAIGLWVIGMQDIDYVDMLDTFMLVAAVYDAVGIILLPFNQLAWKLVL